MELTHLRRRPPVPANAASYPLPATAPTRPRLQPEELSEGLLVKQVRQGDRNAFEALVRRYEQKVLQLVLSIIKNPTDAEEVAQDVFLTVYQKIAGFREEASLSTWIHRIAVNAALMHRRRNRNRAAVPLDDLLPTLDEKGQIAGKVSDWSEQACDPILREETHRIIRAAVDQLDPKYRTVFMLRVVEGFSTQETARILSLKVPATKTRLHRARLFLRKELAAYFELG